MQYVRTSLQGQVAWLCWAEIIDAHIQSVSRLGAGNSNLFHKAAGKLTWRQDVDGEHNWMTPVHNMKYFCFLKKIKTLVWSIFILIS